MACAGDRWEGAYLRECLLQSCIGFIQVIIDDHQVKQARLLAWGGTRDRVRNTGNVAPSGLAPLLTTCYPAMATLAVTVIGWPGLDRTLAYPLLEDLSWGLLPSSPDY